MLNLLWPTKLVQPSNVFVRLGRVLHWLGVIVAIGAVATSIPQILNYFESEYYSADEAISASWASGMIAVVVALAIYLVGRGLRYIFSGE